MNLTISVGEEVLRSARIRALEEHTSVNAVLRDYLTAYAGLSTGKRGAADRLSSNYLETRAPGEGTLNGHATTCMSAEFQFVDTNVPVYLFDNDTPAKQSRSRELFSASLTISKMPLTNQFVQGRRMTNH